MTSQSVRPAAFAGRWYSDRPDALRQEVEEYLAATAEGPRGNVIALIAPHAGLMYSGPVAAHAYRLLQSRRFDVAVIVGPSHYEPFDGVAIHPSGSFASPFGPIPVDEALARDIALRMPLAREHRKAHFNEHSLEMQLPFVGLLAPGIRIVPILMGYQIRETVTGLASALAEAARDRRPLLIASTDLSHYRDAATTAVLDGKVIELVRRFDPEGFMAALEEYPEHACGGGPAVSVMLAARELGAVHAAILKYADSGDVSGDKTSVVGYLAAALGTFES